MSSSVTNESSCIILIPRKKHRIGVVLIVVVPILVVVVPVPRVLSRVLTGSNLPI